MSDQARQYEIFGQKLLIETGGNKVGFPGPAAYILESITDDGNRYNQSLHEGSGLSRIYAEKRLQVDCGIKNSASDISYQLVSHKGEIAINAEGSWVRIKGKNICLEASDQLVLQGAKVRIGYSQRGRTDKIDLVAQKINASCRGGNIGDLLRTSNIFQAFSGSYVIDGLVSGVTKGVGKFGKYYVSESNRKFKCKSVRFCI